MNFGDYQEKALRTVSMPGATGLPALQNAALGLAGEAGEFADSIKKTSFQGHPVDEAHLAEEIGDILWYCALAAKALNKSLADIAQANIDKLSRRYPKGFEVGRSLNRKEQHDDT